MSLFMRFIAERVKKNGGSSGIFWKYGIRRQGDEGQSVRRGISVPEKDHRRGGQAEYRGGQRRGGGHEGLGRSPWGDPFYPLVPAPHRRHRREARQLYLPLPRRRGHHGVLRQGADPGRAGRLLLPIRRAACHLRGQGLHRLGPHLLRLSQG